MDLEATINNRRSVRSFELGGIEDEKLEQIKLFIEEMEVPFAHTVEVKIFNAAPGKKLYTMFNAPRDNLAFITETDYISISKAGFVGEMVILYATGLGLSTCWYGHYHLAELERLMPHLGAYKGTEQVKYGYAKGPVEGRRVICISPLAYWKAKGLRVLDRVQERYISTKRKDIEEILIGDCTVGELSEDILYALDLARKAPSAGNAQFWRYNVAKDQQSIQLAMPVGYNHIKWEHPNVDIGITACHLWLGLKERGLETSVSIKEDRGRAVWQFEITL